MRATFYQISTLSLKLAAAMSKAAVLCIVLLMITQQSAIASYKEPPGWLTESEQLWLRQHPHINVGPDPYYPPIEFFDGEGNFSGIAADYLQEIESILGIKFSIIKLPTWDDVIAKAKAREIDMLSAAAETPNRKLYLKFTTAYLKFPAVIITRQQAIQHTTMAELEGKRVAATKGYAVAEYIKTTYPGIDLIEVNSVEEGLSKLSYGELDAMVSINAPALHYIEKNGIVNLHIAGMSGYFLKIAYATRSDWPLLNSIMQKALNEISAEKAQKIQTKWINSSLNTWQPSQNQILWAILAFMLSTLLLAIFWNHALKSKVRKKTAEIHKHMKALELSRQETYTSEQRLRSIFNSADIGLFIHASDGTIVDMNDKALTMYGMHRDDIKNVSVAGNLSAQDCPFEQIPVYWELTLDGHSQRFPWQAKRFDNDAEFAVEVCLTKLKIPDKDIVLASVRDTSEQFEQQNVRRFLLEETAPIITNYLKLIDEALTNSPMDAPEGIANTEKNPLPSLLDEMSRYLEDYLDAALISYKSRPIASNKIHLSSAIAHVVESMQKHSTDMDTLLDIKTLCEDVETLSDEVRVKKLVQHLLQIATIQANKGTTVTVVIDRTNSSQVKQPAKNTDAISVSITYYGDSLTSNQHIGSDLTQSEAKNRHRKCTCSLYLMSQTLAESLGIELSTESTPNVVTSYKLIFKSVLPDQ